MRYDFIYFIFRKPTTVRSPNTKPLQNLLKITLLRITYIFGNAWFPNRLCQFTILLQNGRRNAIPLALVRLKMRSAFKVLSPVVLCRSRGGAMSMGRVLLVSACVCLASALNSSFLDPSFVMQGKLQPIIRLSSVTLINMTIMV